MSVKVLAAQVRAGRALLGMTQAELASASGVSLPQINRLERGENEPRFTTVQKLVDALRAEGVELQRSPDGEVVIRLHADAAARLFG